MSTGHFVFIVQRGNRKLCEKDDIDQGMAQNILGCKAIPSEHRIFKSCIWHRY